MMVRPTRLIGVFPLLVVLLLCLGGRARADEFRVVAGRSFYTTEPRAELILFGADDLLGRPDLSATVLLGDTPLAQDAPVERGRQVTAPFDMAAVPEGDSEVTCVLTAGDGAAQSASGLVTKLPPRPNAVQIDRVSGAYPHLCDDDFVREHLDEWLA